MAMLQRRMASSVYAVRRSLERMRARRQKILDDPEAYRQEKIERKLPDDFDDLTEEERQQLIDRLEEEVLSVDPAALREEVGRLTTLELERHCAVADITHLGRAWVLPHPERTSPQLAPMVRDEEIERIAVRLAIEHDESSGWVVESVESENRGFDLISRRPHSEDPQTFIEVRFIEVKGRAGVGVVALSSNEFHTAERLKGDYWLYVAFNCSATPQLHTVQHPARLGWQPVMAVEHFQLDANTIRLQKD